MNGGGDKKLTHEMAEEWMDGLQNEDGSRGPTWSLEETKRIMKQKGIEVEPMTFWVAMNAAYSDLAKIAKKYNVNNMDFYVDFAKAFWLHDQDAVEHKLSAYYEAVVEK